MFQEIALLLHLRTFLGHFSISFPDVRQDTGCENRPLSPSGKRVGISAPLVVVGRGVAETSVSFPGWPRVWDSQAQHRRSGEWRGQQGCQDAGRAPAPLSALRFSLASREAHSRTLSPRSFRGKENSLEIVDTFLSVAQQVPLNSRLGLWVFPSSYGLSVCVPLKFTCWNPNPQR